MARGGYRKPMNPAPVSGPGSLSQRTDGGPAKAEYVSDLPWGQGQEFYNTQVSGNDAIREIEQTNMPSGLNTSASSQLPIVGLGEPTMRKDEPVQAGIDSGPGPGSEALAFPKLNQSQDIQVIAKSWPMLDRMRRDPNAPDSFKIFCRVLDNKLRQMQNNEIS